MKKSQYIIRSLFSIGLICLFFSILYIDNNLAESLYASSHFWIYGGSLIFGLNLLFINSSKLQIKLGDYLIFIFVAYIVLQYFISSSQATYRLIEIVLLILLYFCFRIYFSTSSHNKRFGIIIVILLGSIIAIWGLLQLYGIKSSQHRLFLLTGPFYNPGPFSGFLAIILPIAFYTLLEAFSRLKEIKKNTFWQIYSSRSTLFLCILSFVCCILIILVLPAGRSRAAWLAGGISSFILFSAVNKKQCFNKLKTLKKNKVLFISFFSIVILVGSILGLYFLKKDSADGRSFIWKISSYIIADSPVFGKGIGSFASEYGKAQMSYFENNDVTKNELRLADNPEYAFNEYIQITVEYGIIGLILFIHIILASIYEAGKNRNENIPFILSMISFLIFSVFSYPFSVLPFGLVFVFLLAALNSNEYANIQPHEAKRTGFVLKSIVFVGLISLFPIQRNTYKAFKGWGNSYFLTNGQKIKLFNDIYTKLEDQPRFLFEYGQVLSKSELYHESNIILNQGLKFSCDPMFYNIIGKNFQELNNYVEAEKAFFKSIHMIPERLYPYYLLVKMYQKNKEKVKAIQTAEYVINFNSRINSTAIQEMKTECKKIVDDYKQNLNVE